MAYGQDWQALFAALAGPPVEDHLLAVLAAVSELTGDRLVAVWSEESVWGLAGFLGIRRVTAHGWTAPDPDLLAHLYGTWPPTGTRASAPAADLVDNGAAVCVDGVNYALVSAIAA